jgi:hypothetical protein
MGYEGARANDANVPFEYELALKAARGLWSLAGKLREHQSRRVTAASTARTDWTGPKHDQFEEKVRQEGTDTTAVAGGLEDTARALARSWSQARGQQDRINFARYVDHEIDDDNIAEDFVEFFAGEDDYGPPPENPPVPAPPDFTPTRAPMHAEYEGRQ